MPNPQIWFTTSTNTIHPDLARRIAPGSHRVVFLDTNVADCPFNST